MSFEEAARCNPRDWRIRLNVANCHLALGERDKAVAKLQEILVSEPECEPAKTALARALQREESSARRP